MTDEITTELSVGFRHLPENVEAEQALIGAILINNDGYHRVKSILRGEHFFQPVHRRIFAAISWLSEGDKIADYLTMKVKFNSDPDLRNLNRAGYLSSLARASETILNVDDYAREIVDLAAKRAMIQALEQENNASCDPALPDRAALIASKITADLENIVNDIADVELQPSVDVFRERLAHAKEKTLTISTGFECLDRGWAVGFVLVGCMGSRGATSPSRVGFTPGSLGFA